MRLPSLRNIPSLEPSSLSQVTKQAVEELMREGESANTLASYRSALRYWAAWFGVRYGQAITLPLPANAILQFIVDHAQRTTADGCIVRVLQGSASSQGQSLHPHAGASVSRSRDPQ